MALNIKNERVHTLARQAADRTGLSQTSVIEQALERLLADLGEDRDGRDAREQAVRRLVDEFRAGLTAQQRQNIQEDLRTLYDQDGLPA